MKSSWRTTLGGILAGIGTLLAQLGTGPAWLPTAGGILAGVGALILGINARDNKVTSEDAGLK